MNPSKRNLYILTFVLFVVMLGYGIIIPILPFYIESMGAGGMELGLLVASYAVMRLILRPHLGRTLRPGRTQTGPAHRHPGLCRDDGLVRTGNDTLWMLFAARILSGVLSSATAPTTMAFIGDSTPAKERGGGMGLLGAAGGIGTIIGPVLGGFLAGESLATPFFLAAGLSVLSLLLAMPSSCPSRCLH
jgi:MFS transporter, DHA1 family, multidrug resistance protein